MCLVKTAVTLICNARQTGQRSECRHSLNGENVEEDGKGILNGSPLGISIDQIDLIVILFSSKVSE